MSESFVISTIPSVLLDQLGISALGLVTEPQALSFDRFVHWVNLGYAGELKYLCDERKDKRKSLCEIFPNFKSAVVFLFSYPKTPLAENDLKIADYIFAFNDCDYHQILSQRIKKFFSAINISEEHYQIAVDTAPILERDLAYRAGLGWIGKNSMLINRKLGSYFLIASAVFNIEITFSNQKIIAQADLKETDHCGNCRACLDACPTNAIIENQRQIDSRLCISTYTIESFGGDKTPPSSKRGTQEIYGCDICQSVCPWNNKVPMQELSQLKNSLVFENFYKNDIESIIKDLSSMSKRSFKKKFTHTALARTGRDGMIKNLKDKIK